MSTPEDDAFDFSGSDMDGLDGEEGQEQAQEPQQEEGLEVDASQPPAPDAEDELEDEAADLDLERDLKSRLEVAQLYQQVLAQGLIKANTPGAVQVTKEIKRFVQERLRQLMGMGGRSAQVSISGPSVFDQSEIQTLKQLAENGDVLMALAQRVRQGSNKAPVQQVQPITPAVAKKVTPIQAAQPQSALRKVQPKPAVAAPRPAAKPALPQAQRPVPTTGNKPQISGTPVLPAKVPVAKGQRQPTVAERERIDPMYRDDPTLLYKNLQWWVQVRDGDGVPLNVYDVKTKGTEPMLKNVTLPAKPQGRQPAPMPNMRDATSWDMSMAQHSSNSHAGMAMVLDQLPGQGGRGLENASILLAAGFASTPNANSSSTEDEENRP